MRDADPPSLCPNATAERLTERGRDAGGSKGGCQARGAERGRNAARWVGVLTLSVLVASLPFLLVGELPGERWLSAQDDSAALFALTGTLLLSADLLLPIPSSVIGAMLGGRLGLIAGFVCNLSGLLAGHCVGYWLGRLAPERWAARAPSAPSALAVLWSRAVPVFAEAVSLAAGATGMRFRQFALAALLGDAIYAAALAATGAALLPDGWYLTALLVPMLLAAAASWLAWRSGARPLQRAR